MLVIAGVLFATSIYSPRIPEACREPRVLVAERTLEVFVDPSPRNVEKQTAAAIKNALKPLLLERGDPNGCADAVAAAIAEWADEPTFVRKIDKLRTKASSSYAIARVSEVAGRQFDLRHDSQRDPEVAEAMLRSARKHCFGDDSLLAPCSVEALRRIASSPHHFTLPSEHVLSRWKFERQLFAKIVGIRDRHERLATALEKRETRGWALAEITGRSADAANWDPLEVAIGLRHLSARVRVARDAFEQIDALGDLRAFRRMGFQQLRDVAGIHVPQQQALPGYMFTNDHSWAHFADEFELYRAEWRMTVGERATEGSDDEVRFLETRWLETDSAARSPSMAAVRAALDTLNGESGDRAAE